MAGYDDKQAGLAHCREQMAPKQSRSVARYLAKYAAKNALYLLRTSKVGSGSYLRTKIKA